MKKITNFVFRETKQWRIGFIALCTLFTCLTAKSQTTGTVSIGSGTTSAYGMPFDSYNFFSYSQQIVQASEFATGGGSGGNITAVRFYIGTGLAPLANWESWTVYIGHTNKNSFSSTTDWEPVANLTQVFSGNITSVDGQWLELTFSAPFAYNGTSNIIIAVDENSPGKTDGFSATTFGTYAASADTGLRVGSSTDISPATPPAGSRTATLARLQFNATLASCQPPSAILANTITNNSANLAWTAPQTAPSDGYQYYISTTNTAPSATTSGTDAPAVTASLANLTSNTKYFVWVRSKCGTNYSAWIPGASFTTMCDATNVPYTEDFESVTTPALPACTVAVNEGLGNIWNTTSPATTAFNTKVLRYPYTYAGEANTWFYTRGLNLTAGTIYRVSYKYGGSNYTEKLAIGYGMSAQSSAMTQIADHPEITGSAATLAYVDFTPSTTGVYYIGFKAYSALGQNSLYVDDISVMVAPSCSAPTGVAASTVGINNAVIGWTPNAVTSGHQYYYSTTNTAPTASATPVYDVASPETSVDIQGLTSNTVYYVWVRNNCGNNDLSAWSQSATFRTLCDAANIPYTEDFESVTTPALPVCTMAVNEGTGNIWNTTSPATTAFNTKVLRYPYTSAGAANTWFYTRGLNLTGGTSYRLSYKYGGSGYTEKMDVGYGMDTQSGAMTQIADHPEITGTAATTTYVDFIPSTTGVYYIGFHAYSASGQNSLYVDNISVIVTPTCNVPTALLVDSVGPNNAIISWTPDGVSAGYEYYYSTTNTAPGASATPVYPISASETTANIQNLTSNTVYYVWVRNNCGNNDLSTWSQMATFKTLCDATNVPYSEDFESATTPALPACTIAINEGTGNTWATATPAAGGFNNKALRYTVSYTAAGNTWFYTRGLNLTAGTSYRVSYRYGASSTFSTEKLEVGYGMATNSAAMTQLADYPSVTGTTPTSTYVDFTPSTTGVYYIGFKAYSAASQNYLYVDDILVVVTPTCNAPTALTVDSVGTNNAVISWTPDGVTTGYQYYYSTTNTAPDAAATPVYTIGSSETSANIQNLTSNTVYYVWVRNNCGNNDLSAWSQSATFRTLCDPTGLPYTEDFESATTPALPVCTMAVNEGTGNIWNTTSPAANGFNSKVLRYPYTYAGAANTWFYTRGLNLTAGTSYRVSYKYGGSGYTEKMEVSYGMATQSTAMTQIADHPSITGSTPTTTYVDFIPSTTGVYYIGFHAYSASGQNSLYVDDISVMVTPTCFPPTAVTASGTGLTTATVSWTPTGTPAEGFQYYYNTVNTPPTATSNPQGTAAAGTTSANISGLASSTTYFIWVRSNCGNSDLSQWSAVATFATECEPANVPFTENFEGATVPGMPACSSVVNNGVGNSWTTAALTGGGFTSTGLRYSYTYAGAANTWFFTRAVSLTAGQTYKLTYKYGANTTGSYVEKLKVGYGTAANAGSMTQLADHASITGSTPNNGSVDFIPQATGTYYFGFQAYSALGQNVLYIDDIVVDAVLANEAFDAKSFRFYPNPVKDVLNLSYSSDITSVAVYNLLGQQVLVKEINATEAAVDMSALADGTYVVNVTSGESVKTLKVIKKQ